MLSSTITCLLLFLLTCLARFTSSSPISHQPSKSAEIYYLTNCFNNNTFAAYAEIDYYPNSALSHSSQPPNKKAIINTANSIDYEDGTWTATTPFKFKVYIDVDAYTATAGTLIGNANSSTFVGTMNCYRETRFVLYESGVNEQCYTDYSCIDS